MKTTAMIEIGRDLTYDIYTIDENLGFMLLGQGGSITAAKADLLRSKEDFSIPLRCTRNDVGVIGNFPYNVKELGCDEKLFVTVVKQAFNQRRKTLRNSLRSLIPVEIIENEIFNKRPEQLSVTEFVELTRYFEPQSRNLIL